MAEQEVEPKPRHDPKLSKTLSWLLRHQAVSQGLDMQENGYVPCSQVVSLLAKRCIPGMTQKRLEDEVAACPKRRLEFSPSRKHVRASRGHSIRSVKDAQLLTPMLDADAASALCAVYGTSLEKWESVKTLGLRCGARNHLHIATRGCKTGFVIGKANTNANVLIYIDMKACLAAGIAFYIASTGILLTRGQDDSGCLPATFFSRAVLCNPDETDTELLP